MFVNPKLIIYVPPSPFGNHKFVIYDSDSVYLL